MVCRPLQEQRWTELWWGVEGHSSHSVEPFAQESERLGLPDQETRPDLQNPGGRVRSGLYRFSVVWLQLFGRIHVSGHGAEIFICPETGGGDWHYRGERHRRSKGDRRRHLQREGPCC